MWSLCCAAWMGWAAWLWKTRAYQGPRCAVRPVLRPIVGEARWRAAVAWTLPPEEKTEKATPEELLVVFFGP